MKMNNRLITVMRSFLSPCVVLLFFMFSFYLFLNQGPGGYEGESFRAARDLSVRMGLIPVSKIGVESVVARTGFLNLWIATIPVSLGHHFGCFLGMDGMKMSYFVYCLSLITFPAALGPVIVLIWVRQLGYRCGLKIALLYGLGTLIVPYASVGMEPLMITMLLLGFSCLTRYRQNPTGWNLFILCLTVGALSTAKAYSVIFVPPLFLGAVSTCYQSNRWDVPRLRIICVGFFLAAMFFFLSFGVQNWLAGIHSLKPGYAYMKKNLFFGFDVLGAWVGIWGYLASPGKSIFIYSPPCLLGLIGAAWFAKKHRDETLAILTCLAVNILFFSALRPLWADETWGPRYLLPAVPLLMVMASPTLDRAASFFSAKAFVWLLAVLGSLIQWIGNMFIYSTALDVLRSAGLLSMAALLFIPKLTHLYINTMLTLSFFSRCAVGHSLTFSYSVLQPPLYKDPHTVSLALAGWDQPQVWWIRLLEDRQGQNLESFPAVWIWAALIGLIVLMVITALQLAHFQKAGSFDPQQRTND